MTIPEYQNGTSPYTYDKTGKERATAILKGIVYGDFEVPDDLETLLGQLAGAFIPFFADGRDYVANVFVNGKTAAALMNVGGFLADGVPFAGAGVDTLKVIPKITKFIVKHADDAALITGAFAVTSKHLPDAEKAFAEIVKRIPVGSFDECLETVSAGSKITKTDSELLVKAAKLSGRSLDAVSEYTIKNADLSASLEMISKKALKDMIDEVGDKSARKYIIASQKFAAGKKGSNGIKKLSGKGIQGYQYEVKVLGKKEGAYRLLGNKNEKGEFIWEVFERTHK